MAARFEYRQAQELAAALAQHGVRYLFIGKSVKDRESLPRLKAFREWWITRHH